MNEQLFDIAPEPPRVGIAFKSPHRSLWSQNKAKLITEYLRTFVYITRHGTYIDAFAGPQTDQSEQAWAAQMVISSEPKRLRNFYLFDKSPRQEGHLRRLASDNSDRNVQVYLGDSNLTLPVELPVGSIREREATFCLLDQRTFECEWQLCKHISQLRTGPMKVEQFYFLANRWMSRALSTISTEDSKQKVKAWLGRDDWRTFKRMTPYERVEVFIDKFRNELGYQFVNPWPIYKKDGGTGAVMYYMIHASDHHRAPKLMYDAYMKAVDPETFDQPELPF